MNFCVLKYGVTRRNIIARKSPMILCNNFLWFLNKMIMKNSNINFKCIQYVVRLCVSSIFFNDRRETYKNIFIWCNTYRLLSFILISMDPYIDRVMFGQECPLQKSGLLCVWDRTKFSLVTPRASPCDALEPRPKHSLCLIQLVQVRSLAQVCFPELLGNLLCNEISAPYLVFFG